jgi:hypothetical protein
MANDHPDLNEQLAALQRENEALRRENERVRAERTAVFNKLFADLDAQAPTEEEVAAGMKDARPIDEVFAELGVVRPGSQRP